jgi:hypothetical protein
MNVPSNDQNKIIEAFDQAQREQDAGKDPALEAEVSGIYGMHKTAEMVGARMKYLRRRADAIKRRAKKRRAKKKMGNISRRKNRNKNG